MLICRCRSRNYKWFCKDTSGQSSWLVRGSLRLTLWGLLSDGGNSFCQHKVIVLTAVAEQYPESALLEINIHPNLKFHRLIPLQWKYSRRNPLHVWWKRKGLNPGRVHSYSPRKRFSCVDIVRRFVWRFDLIASVTPVSISCDCTDGTQTAPHVAADTEHAKREPCIIFSITQKQLRPLNQVKACQIGLTTPGTFPLSF